MNEEKPQQEKELEEEEKKKKKEIPLPYCTTAPDPEHHRAHHEDEPCDDARSGPDELHEEDDEAN
jgi:hypothetical protein